MIRDMEAKVFVSFFFWGQGSTFDISPPKASNNTIIFGEMVFTHNECLMSSPDPKNTFLLFS